jgi:hypothetical protein
MHFLLILFAIVAAEGVILALHVLFGKFAPWAMSLMHGLLGGIGVSYLVYTILSGPTPPNLVWAFIFFLCAAPLGVVLATFHLRRKLPPKVGVFVHAGCAVSGFVVLAYTAFPQYFAVLGL